MENTPDLTRLFDTLHATDDAAESGILDSTHYRNVDDAIGEVLQQLSPIYPASSSSSESDESLAQETKAGPSAVETSIDPSSAKKLQALLAQHEGPRRDMVEDEAALKVLQDLFPFMDSGKLAEMLSAIDRREEMVAKLFEASSDVGGRLPKLETAMQVENVCVVRGPKM